MPTIYRIEDSRSYGMYHSPSFDVQRAMIQLQALDQVDGKSFHPSPWDDEELLVDIYKNFKSNLNLHFYFGFNSKKQLKRWVYKSDVKKVLEDAGLRIVQLEVERIAVGDTQSVYIPKESKVVTYHRLTTF